MENLDKNYQKKSESASESDYDYIREKRREAEEVIGDVAKMWEYIAVYAAEMKKKYPNWREYQLFNVLIGSTINEERMPYLDFPAPDSAKEFIEKLASGEK